MRDTAESTWKMGVDKEGVNIRRLPVKHPPATAILKATCQEGQRRIRLVLARTTV